MGSKGQRMSVMCKNGCGVESAPCRAVCNNCYKLKRRGQRRKETLNTRYGITIEQYVTWVKQQNHVCAICKLPETSKHQNGQVKRLAVDHCHATGKIRGLLCKSCNQGIGLLKESPIITINAASYVALGGI